MPLVSQPAPDFRLACVATGVSAPFDATLADYAGGWLLLAFYPRDFSFVCPTELVALSARHHEFAARNCRILAASVDSCDTHREWLASPPSAGGVGALQFPLASDADGRVADAYGAWQPDVGLSLRGLFLIDPQGLVQYSVVHNLAVGRNVDEILRVLDALQSDGLCPASWTNADGTIDVERGLHPGRVLGHYRIQRLLGHGTFGNVFAARDLRLDRVVALKVLKSNSPGSRDCVLREARSAAALDHPHVCRILTVEFIDGLPLIVMEFLDGPPLTDLIGQKLEDAARRDIARGLASGLAAAHARHIVHGDLKPGNVLVTHGRKPHILDFGLARSLHEAARRDESNAPAPATNAAPGPLDATASVAAVTSASALGDARSSRATFFGTPAYLAPEQWDGGPSSPASDVFALGLILAEILTDRRAPEAESLARLLTRFQSTDYVARLIEPLEPSLRGLLAEALSTDPVARPSAADIAARLR